VTAARFVVAFAVAVLALRGVWAALREAVHGAGPEAWLWAAAWAALLAGSFLYAGFVLYGAERNARRLRRRVGLYERFLAGGHR